MHHNLFAVFPLPVVLALVSLVILLLALMRVLAQLCRPVPVRVPPPARERQQPAMGELS